MDMANNYKDNAQDDFAELEKVFEELTAAKNRQIILEHHDQPE